MTGDFIFSSAYDKTARAWLFDTNDLDAGHEAEACIKTFSGHTKGVYPLIFIPAEETVGVEVTTKGEIHPGDVLITGSADQTARSWSFETAGCLKVSYFQKQRGKYLFVNFFVGTTSSSSYYPKHK